MDPDWEEVPMDDGSGTVYYRHKTTYETRCVVAQATHLPCSLCLL